MRIAVAAGLVVVALASTAAAQAPVAPRGEELSENVALGLSLGATLVSWGVFIAGTADGGDDATTVAAIGAIGTMFGPGAGHIYSGELVTRGFGIRAAGILGMGLGLGIALASCPIFSFDDDDSDSCDQGSAIGAAVAIAGVGLYVAGTVDDIVMAPRKVRKHNQALKSVALAPLVTTTSAGLALGGRF